MNQRVLVQLFSGMLTAAGVAACGSSSEPEGSQRSGTQDAAGTDSDAESVDADADSGFCVNDLPPEMRNYPGCYPPFCVPLELEKLEAGISDAEPLPCGVLCGPSVRPVVACEDFEYEGQVWLKCQMDCTGRRPAGFRSEGAKVADLGTYFAEMARLEAASITAFRLLGRELALHGAPRSLRRAARRAARDEIRHTRATRALSSRFGGAPVAPRITMTRPRPLVEIAVENAREGCVRETFGALVASYQARAATDPSVRRVLRGIARDEIRHAALGWRVKRWADLRLDRLARRQVEEALVAEARTLGATLDIDPPRQVAAIAGIPPRHVLATFVKVLGCELWSAEIPRRPC